MTGFDERLSVNDREEYPLKGIAVEKYKRVLSCTHIRDYIGQTDLRTYSSQIPHALT